MALKTTKRKDESDPFIYDVWGNKYKPRVVGHRLLVEVDPVTEPGKIILSEAQKAMEQLGQAFGTIIDISPHCWKDLGGREIRKKSPTFNVEEVIKDGEPWAEIGDKVYFQRNAGARIWDPRKAAFREDLMFLNDKDIMAVLRPVKEAKDAGQRTLRAV